MCGREWPTNNENIDLSGGNKKLSNLETGKTWKGIDPNKLGKSGMHWVTIPSKLEQYEN